jgi:2'-5' RNA ligase
MRVFIAIDIEKDILGEIARLQDKLQSAIDYKRGVKWVDPEGMHLTLKFLGEIRDDQVSEICDELEAAAAGHKAFDLGIETVGSFGGGSPRVLWVGTGAGSVSLEHLQKDIDKRLSKIGWAKEKRRFAGHLTLCRIRDGRVGNELKIAIDEYRGTKFGQSFIESVKLYQSNLTPDGAVYTVLASYQLNQ